MAETKPTDPSDANATNDAYPIPPEAEAVFNAVTGPNFRMRDNMIQLAVIIISAILGTFVGRWLGSGSRDQDLWTVGGGFIGLVGSLAISGLVIGAVRVILSCIRIGNDRRR
jgi:hypothetical protein